MSNDGDSQKNYATVSLCCLSVTNPFRNKIIQIVSVNPWFDRFILFVILFNCLFLALDKEVDIVSNNMEVIDLVFLIIYTWEMTMKIIAMGFFMRAHSYLRDSWNIVSTIFQIEFLPHETNFYSFAYRWTSVLWSSVGSVPSLTVATYQPLRLSVSCVHFVQSTRSRT